MELSPASLSGPSLQGDLGIVITSFTPLMLTMRERLLHSTLVLTSGRREAQFFVDLDTVAEMGKTFRRCQWLSHLRRF